MLKWMCWCHDNDMDILSAAVCGVVVVMVKMADEAEVVDSNPNSATHYY